MKELFTDPLGRVFLFAIIGVVSVVCGVLYFIFGGNETKPCLNMVSFIETKQKITPDFKLEVNGKTVDTIWIYSKTEKFK